MWHVLVSSRIGCNRREADLAAAACWVECQTRTHTRTALLFTCSHVAVCADALALMFGSKSNKPFALWRSWVGSTSSRLGEQRSQPSRDSHCTPASSSQQVSWTKVQRAASVFMPDRHEPREPRDPAAGSKSQARRRDRRRQLQGRRGR